MNTRELLDRFRETAAHPDRQFRQYLGAGEKVVLTAPPYAPEEIIHAMGLVPFGAWGGGMPLERAKEYFPAFLCSIVQSILELGMAGTYQGACAIVMPSLCDSLKCLGQNWKRAVPQIPFIPMTYPQNRFGEVGRAFTRAGYRRVASDLEQITGKTLTEEALKGSISVYNEHNEVMRRVDEALAAHPEVTASQRSDIFKSAFFMRKEEHTALARELLSALGREGPGGERKTRVLVSGILCDSPALLSILDELGYHIVADDLAAQSRQYRVDAPTGEEPEESLSRKFERMGLCSVLYDPDKMRPGHIAALAQRRGARGVIVALTKFCDPEEFDYPLIKKACAAAGLPVLKIEVDRQTQNFEQARTLLEAFRDVIA